MTKSAVKSTGCDAAQATTKIDLSPELKAAASFTAQLLALDVGEIAVKAAPYNQIAAVDEDQAENRSAAERQRLRNTVWASIKAAQVREKGRYASRQFAVEVIHVCRGNGSVIVQAIVERTA